MAQERCLGPLLYVIFPNGITVILNKAIISMYPNYSSIYILVTTKKELNVKWKRSNKVILNVCKSNSIITGSNLSI